MQHGSGRSSATFHRVLPSLVTHRLMYESGMGSCREGHGVGRGGVGEAAGADAYVADAYAPSRVERASWQWSLLIDFPPPVSKFGYFASRVPRGRGAQEGTSRATHDDARRDVLPDRAMPVTRARALARARAPSMPSDRSASLRRGAIC